MVKPELLAVVFDMDGLLIDSEPYWQEAEIEVFARLGVPLTREMCHQTLGMRIDGVVRYWHERYPWGSSPKFDSVESDIIEAFISRFVGCPLAKPGASSVFDKVRGAGLPIAIASSSYLRVIEAAMSALDLHEFVQVMHSAEFEERGKPDPAVYLSSAELLQVAPESCLAFEDSPSGLQAAKEAGMRCIFIPDQFQPDETVEELADLILDSLNDFSFSSVSEWYGGRAGA